MDWRETCSSHTPEGREFSPFAPSPSLRAIPPSPLGTRGLGSGCPPGGDLRYPLLREPLLTLGPHPAPPPSSDKAEVPALPSLAAPFTSTLPEFKAWVSASSRGCPGLPHPCAPPLRLRKELCPQAVTLFPLSLVFLNTSPCYCEWVPGWVRKPRLPELPGDVACPRGLKWQILH